MINDIGSGDNMTSELHPEIERAKKKLFFAGAKFFFLFQLFRPTFNISGVHTKAK
jgi:hypothetical protein